MVLILSSKRIAKPSYSNNNKRQAKKLTGAKRQREVIACLMGLGVLKQETSAKHPYKKYRGK